MYALDLIVSGDIHAIWGNPSRAQFFPAFVLQKADCLGELKVFADRKDRGKNRVEEILIRKEKPWLKGLHVLSPDTHRVQKNDTGTRQIAPVSKSDC